MKTRMLLGTASLLMLSPSAMAQWVSFTDDTGSRLQLTSVSINDDEEKDVVVDDFNMDGVDDVVVVRKEPFSNPGPRSDVLLINENGVLVDRTDTLASEFISSPTDSRDVVSADFTGDGWPDLVIASTFEDQPAFYRNRGANTRGTWLGFVREDSRLPGVFPVNQPLGPKFCAVWAGDLDGVNGPDLYFSNYQPGGTGTTDVLLMNDGTGNFTDDTATRLGSYANVAFGTSVEFHDVDNDDDLDIIKMTTLYTEAPFGLGTYILYNEGGFFNTRTPTAFPDGQPYMFTGADLDGNDYPDFYVVDDFDDVMVFITGTDTNGDVQFSTAVINSIRTDRFGGNCKFADVDGDGDLDIGVGPIDVDIQNCGAGDEFALLRNTGNGVFDDPYPVTDSRNFHDEAHDFGFLDVNGDGCLDIIMALCTGWKVLIQDNCPCAGDITGVGGEPDGSVGTDDFFALLQNWGPCPAAPADCPWDLTGSGNTPPDGVVGTADFFKLLQSWGPCS